MVYGNDSHIGTNQRIIANSDPGMSKKSAILIYRDPVAEVDIFRELDHQWMAKPDILSGNDRAAMEWAEALTIGDGRMPTLANLGCSPYPQPMNKLVNPDVETTDEKISISKRFSQ